MNPAAYNPALLDGVIAKRIVALLFDLAAIFLLWFALAISIGIFGLLTLSLGWHLYALMPLVPFCYHLLTLARFGATPGQHFTGLAVRQIETMQRPTFAQALVSVLGFYITLAVGAGILLLVAFVTQGKRTLHDIASGLIVVRADALPAGYLP